MRHIFGVIAALSLVLLTVLLGPAPGGAVVEDPEAGPNIQGNWTAPTEPRTGLPGEGWYLAAIDRNRDSANGPRLRRQELALVSPDGTRTTVFASRARGGRDYWSLAGWAPDGATALLHARSGAARQFALLVDLATGAVARVRLRRQITAIGLGTGDTVLAIAYPRRDARPALVRVDASGTMTRIASGTSEWVLPHPSGETVVESARGSRLAVRSLADGKVTSSIPTSRQCQPVRWWDETTVLATCGLRRPPLRATLVPIDGRLVTELASYTKVSPPGAGDAGDLDARRLGGRTYFETSTGDCGPTVLTTRDRRGRFHEIDVPDAGNRPVDLVDATEGELVVSFETGCGRDPVRPLLAGLDPQTLTMRPLLRLRRGAALARVLPFGEVRMLGE